MAKTIFYKKKPFGIRNDFVYAYHKILRMAVLLIGSLLVKSINSLEVPGENKCSSKSYKTHKVFYDLLKRVR